MLKSSSISINFVPFNQADDNCFYCGVLYFQTPLFEQKYCKNCLFLYIKSITNNNIYSSECYCNKRKPSNGLEPCTRMA